MTERLRDAAQAVARRGHFPGCAMHAGVDRMMDERRCDCGISALRAALERPQRRPRNRDRVRAEVLADFTPADHARMDRLAGAVDIGEQLRAARASPPQE